jgi:hypothetical protein
MNVGDKVILLDNVITERLKYDFRGSEFKLTEAKGSIYTIRVIKPYGNDDNIQIVLFDDYKLFNTIIMSTSVITIIDLRKNKIDKLLSNLNIVK